MIDHSEASAATLPRTRLSVIVPCFNNADTIGGQLAALAGQEYDGWWEVIVADNGSTDGSRGVVESYRPRLPRLSLVDASERRGAGHARNAGARTAEGDFLLFCDADDEVGEGWLRAMADAADEADFLASSCYIERLNEPWLWATRGVPIPGERLTFPPYLPHAGGSGLGVRRDLFEAVGGFDDMLACQDTEFCIRVQLAGAALQVADGAAIHCRFRRDWRDVYRKAGAWGESSAALFSRYGNAYPKAGLWLKWPFRHWRAIFRSALRASDRGERLKLAFVLGWQVGRIRGSFRYRVPAI
jgi:glycosyltransferase involved in cell wall biosynthesis